MQCPYQPLKANVFLCRSYFHDYEIGLEITHLWLVGSLPTSKLSVSSIHFVVPRFNLHEELNCHIDCVQILHPSDRNGEVRVPHYLASFMSSDPLAAGTDGSGNVRTVVKSVNTDTPSRQVSCSSRNARRLRRQRRQTRSVWRSSSK